MRSKWKDFNNFNNSIGCRIMSDNKIYVMNKSSRVTLDLCKYNNGKIFVYNGRSFRPKVISEKMIGYKIGEFFLTKKLGTKIHESIILRRSQKIKKVKKK